MLIGGILIFQRSSEAMACRPLPKVHKGPEAETAKEIAWDGRFPCEEVRGQTWEKKSVHALAQMKW